MGKVSPHMNELTWKIREFHFLSGKRGALGPHPKSVALRLPLLNERLAQDHGVESGAVTPA